MLDRNAGMHQETADPVSELLLGMRLRGARYGKLRLAPPFGLQLPATAEAHFHFIAAGPLYLQCEGSEPHKLNSGDAVLLPRGQEHALLSEPGVPLRPLDSLRAAQLCHDICLMDACPEGTCRTKDILILSGSMVFDLDSLHPLVELMPQLLSVRELLSRQPEIMPLLRAMEREMNEARAGAAGIAARLADVIAASIVRGWVESGCGNATGWVEALRDPQLGRVIAALHRNPGRNWTVAEMAAEMGSSRSVFAERFTAATGVTPLRYLANLRMRLATQWLAQERLAIDTVAKRLGYASHAAFARAYKRVAGHPPGAARTSKASPPPILLSERSPHRSVGRTSRLE